MAWHITTYRIWHEDRGCLRIVTIYSAIVEIFFWYINVHVLLIDIDWISHVRDIFESAIFDFLIIYSSRHGFVILHVESKANFRRSIGLQWRFYWLRKNIFFFRYTSTFCGSFITSIYIRLR